ncbi:MAG: TetR family transcriptional regulator [Acidobacteria bacterium]|nr:TetR family transcriptional regulator [Acidobacteriota bacterium]
MRSALNRKQRRGAPGRTPGQARSRASLRRLLDSAETLLRRRPYGDITVQDLAAAASVSTGFLYTRFDGRAALLEYLVDTFAQQQREQTRAFFEASKWTGVGLEQRLNRLIEQMIDSVTEHRGIMRAIWDEQWAGRASALPQGSVASVFPIPEIVEWLSECRNEIHHPSPQHAVPLALFMITNTLQVPLLYGTPKEIPENLPAMRREVLHMAMAYLQNPSPASERAAVDS